MTEQVTKRVRQLGGYKEILRCRCEWHGSIDGQRRLYPCKDHKGRWNTRKYWACQASNCKSIFTSHNKLIAHREIHLI